MSASTCMSTSTSATLDRKAARGHWLPFAVWMGGMLLLQVLAEVATLPRWAAPVVYAAKSLLCAALLLRDRPWRLYTGMRIADWVPAAAAGLVVAAIWIVPETPLAGRVFPAFQTFYHRWLILPFGRLPSYFDLATFPLGARRRQVARLGLRHRGHRRILLPRLSLPLDSQRRLPLHHTGALRRGRLLVSRSPFRVGARPLAGWPDCGCGLRGVGGSYGPGGSGCYGPCRHKSCFGPLRHSHGPIRFLVGVASDWVRRALRNDER